MIRSKLFLSWCAVVIIGLSLIAVFGTYAVSYFQPFRGPSKAYFWIFLFASLLSSRLAIWLIIFSLPLMPSFHLQLEFITQPAVKYFFAYSGVDAIVGLFLGMQIKHYFEKRKYASPFILPPWPFGLLLLILTCSTVLAISRNIWQSASIFSFFNFFANFFNFKLISGNSDYLPIADLIVFGIGMLLALIIAHKLKDINDKNSIVFKPLVISLLVSASWGIFQALTAFGLDDKTISIRTDFFGYGSLGFQPDTHAFAALMIIGAIGLTGFIRACDSALWRMLTVGTSVLCWIAILLSKSRASLGLAIAMALVLVFLSLSRLIKSRIYIFIVLTIGIFCIYFLIYKSSWLYSLYVNHHRSFFDTFNLLSAWRLDLHMAAINMWSQFPLLGIGLGNFYRTSAIYEFSGSTLMTRLGGENAHNYFLQLLTEIGLIGFLCFVLVLIFPRLILGPKKILTLVYIPIFSMFLGNIYSHSFLIRENYFLLMIFIGVLYSFKVSSDNKYGQESIACEHKINLKKSFFIILFLIFLMYFVIREVSFTHSRTPYQFGRECYRSSFQENDRWSRARYIIILPPASHGVRFRLNSVNEGKNRHEFPITLELFDRLKNIIVSKHFRSSFTDDLLIEIHMPEQASLGADGGVAVLSLTGCVGSQVPANGESRAMPLVIKDIEIF